MTLELNGIAKTVSLPGRIPLRVLREVSLRVEGGDVVAILGRSGSGKSTLLNILGLLDGADEGTYLVDGQDTSKLSDRRQSRLRGEHFGFVFQNFHLMDRRRAIDNVAAPLFHSGPREYRERRRVSESLIAAVGLTERAHSLPSQLSGGEQQRIALARSLVRSPAVILADEPTGSLDVETGASILDLLVTLVRERGASLIVVTHDPVVAAQADRILNLVDGVLEGPKL